MLGHCSLWHVHLSEIRTVSVLLHPQRAEAKPALPKTLNPGHHHNHTAAKAKPYRT
jgi:hypothetical protein